MTDCSKQIYTEQNKGVNEADVQQISTDILLRSL